jgi:transposase
MVFTIADKGVIQACVEKGHGGKRILKEFGPGKGWRLRAVHRLVKKIKDTGRTNRKKGSGRPRTETTDENREYVEEVTVSQEDEPGRHKSQRKIASELNVSRRSVQRMAKELKLMAFKRIHVSSRDANARLKRKTLARNLNDRYSAESVKRIVFTDEKDFTYEISGNRQNDRVYGTRKMEIPPARLYHETSRFTNKVMVSVGISWNGKTDIHFIDTQSQSELRKLHALTTDFYRTADVFTQGMITSCSRMVRPPILVE